MFYAGPFYKYYLSEFPRILKKLWKTEQKSVKRCKYIFFQQYIDHFSVYTLLTYIQWWLVQTVFGDSELYTAIFIFLFHRWTSAIHFIIIKLIFHVCRFDVFWSKFKRIHSGISIAQMTYYVFQHTSYTYHL